MEFVIARKYTGRWQLIPELCFYETGNAPEDATYDISVAGPRVEVSITWTKDGERETIEFGGPLDGSLHPLNPSPNSEVSCTHIDEATLESAVFIDGVRTGFARRQVSEDGSLMSVLQITASGDGAETRILQVYRRIA